MKKTMLLALMLSALSATSFAQSSATDAVNASTDGGVYGGDTSGINDPLIRKRAQDYAAKQEYKADKQAAKQQYKQDARAAKQQYREQRQEARQERSDALNSSGGSGTSTYNARTPATND